MSDMLRKNWRLFAIVGLMNAVAVFVNGYVKGYAERQADLVYMAAYQERISEWKEACKSKGEPYRRNWEWVCVKGEIVDRFED